MILTFDYHYAWTFNFSHFTIYAANFCYSSLRICLRERQNRIHSKLPRQMPVSIDR